ncbi:MAG TPA: outer membrane beta-barrel protein [Saprospiraceae bacterium]|nr:outer membrane beta-barrel protein [Saprospiraceae bacterium]
MKNLVFSFLLFSFPLILISQKGFQIGAGLNYILSNNESQIYLNEDKVSISNLYGASLNLDYRFNEQFKLKSGLEYKSQKINLENLTSYRAEYISIPLILNITVLQLEETGLSFSLDAGGSFDKPVVSSFDYIKLSEDSELKKETPTTFRLDTDGLPTRVFEFDHHISLRLGINATYNIGKRGQLNFFVHKTNRGFNWYFPFRINEQIFINGQEISNIDRKGVFSVTNTGFQFGLYYTFGTLTFK